MADFVQHPVVQALAWALVHFVWQGTAIGLAAFLALRAARTATLRYAIGVGALALMLAAPVATFIMLDTSVAAAASHQGPIAAPVVPAPAQPASSDAASASAAAIAAPTPFRVSPETLAIAVIGWLGGVVFFSIRLFGGWIVARGVARRTVTPAAERVQDIARELAARLSVRRVVQVLESATIAVPVMVGWLKPAIVLPVAALANLTPSQLEALIAHELAHVRRHDYLVNVLQSVVEAVLFYHPAVWWLSRQVRTERELCCDDLAVGVCDRLVYATALTDLATLVTPRLALAATDGNLLNRVRRILGHADEAATVRAGLMPVMALALAAAVAVPAALASGTPDPVAPVDQARADVQLIGQVGVAVTAEPTSTEFNQSQALQAIAEVEPAQATEQDRQRQIEEIRRKIEELQKVLAQLDRGTVDVQRVEDVRKLIEAQQQAAHVKQDEIKKLVEKQSQVQNNEDQRRAMEAMLADLAKVRDERDVQIAAARSLDRQSMDSQAALLQAAAARLQAEAALARAKALYEKGLVSEAQMREAELAYKKLQAGNDPFSKQLVDMQEARAKLERARELAQKGLVAQRDVEQARQEMLELERRLDQRVMERPVGGSTDPLASEAKVNRDQRRTMEPAADQKQAVKRGDILRITIQGEPDLPSTYEVTADGTVRIPFLGAVKVTDLTAADVRTAVGKQLADRKLGSADRVTVTLMRR